MDGQRAGRQSSIQRVHDEQRNRALSLGTAPIEWNRWHYVGGDLVLNQEIADLGAVAVGENHLEAFADEIGHVLHRGRDGQLLVDRASRTVGSCHRISTEGN
ncbi:hypothetical protein GALL_475930 [mine drainage metagenome]|uniref:Uncharacterized protein n=1 Tax=mine drainage metagenome TaxID=410659 RepID=A0A1J5PGQ5_9ZZZZ